TAAGDGTVLPPVALLLQVIFQHLERSSLAPGGPPVHHFHRLVGSDSRTRPNASRNQCCHQLRTHSLSPHCEVSSFACLSARHSGSSLLRCPPIGSCAQ